MSGWVSPPRNLPAFNPKWTKILPRWKYSNSALKSTGIRDCWESFGWLGLEWLTSVSSEAISHTYEGNRDRQPGIDTKLKVRKKHHFLAFIFGAWNKGWCSSTTPIRNITCQDFSKWFVDPPQSLFLGLCQWWMFNLRPGHIPHSKALINVDDRTSSERLFLHHT